jgi:hypothetical protein
LDSSEKEKMWRKINALGYFLDETEFETYQNVFAPRLTKRTDLLRHVIDLARFLLFSFIVFFETNLHGKVDLCEDKLLQTLDFHGHQRLSALAL